MSFSTEINDKTAEIEKVLDKYLPKQGTGQELIFESMAYSLLGGGKRLRPMLMKETFSLFGGTDLVIEPFMAAIKMVHIYSLVHDDLPAMDNDEYRHGKKANHIVYGEDIAILTGDALLNQAFESAMTAFDIAPEKGLLIGLALQVFARKTGVLGMIGGQVIDVKSVGKNLESSHLEAIYKMKTSALMEASMMIGAILADASSREVSTIEEVASKIGMAFQIQDDILDIESSLEILGKATHSDEKNQKTTYVTLFGLGKAKEEVEKLSKSALDDLKSLNRENLFLEELLQSLVRRTF